MQVFETLFGAVYLSQGLAVSQEAALKHIFKISTLSIVKSKVQVGRRVSNMNMQKSASSSFGGVYTFFRPSINLIVLTGGDCSPPGSEKSYSELDVEGLFFSLFTIYSHSHLINRLHTLVLHITSCLWVYLEIKNCESSLNGKISDKTDDHLIAHLLIKSTCHYSRSKSYVRPTYLKVVL